MAGLQAGTSTGRWAHCVRLALDNAFWSYFLEAAKHSLQMPPTSVRETDT
jgi:hypothetical protein